MSAKKKTAPHGRSQPDTGRPDVHKRRGPGWLPNLPPKVSAAILQTMLPSYADPIVRQGKRPGGVHFQSYTVQRSVQRGRRTAQTARPSMKAIEAAATLPGWAFDIPAPDPRERLLWMEISTPWQFWEWSGSWYNDSSNDIRIDGSVDWLWYLGANPNYISGYLPTFLSGQGHFTFYTLVPPGDVGFDVAWLVDPNDQTFTDYSVVPGQLTALEDLLSTKVGDALRLWLSLGFFNPKINGNMWNGPGWFNGGTQSINVVYAYSGVPLPVPDLGGLVFEP